MALLCSPPSMTRNAFIPLIRKLNRFKKPRTKPFKICFEFVLSPILCQAISLKKTTDECRKNKILHNTEHAYLITRNMFLLIKTSQNLSITSTFYAQIKGSLYIVLHLTFKDVMQRMCKNTIRIKSHKCYHYWK